MIDGLILLIELGLFLLLLWSIYRAERNKSEGDLGWFSYQNDKKPEKEKSKRRKDRRA